MTQTQRDAIAAPTTGLMVYQTDNNAGCYLYDGRQWTNVKGGNLSSATLQVYYSRTGTGQVIEASTAGEPTTEYLELNKAIYQPTEGTFDGTTFMALHSGLYLITVSVKSAAGPAPALKMLLNGLVIADSADVDPAEESAVPCSNLYKLLPMGEGDRLCVKMINDHTTPVITTTDGGTKILITRLS